MQLSTRANVENLSDHCEQIKNVLHLASGVTQDSRPPGPQKQGISTKGLNKIPWIAAPRYIYRVAVLVEEEGIA